ncbi:MAG: hypothetical protein V1733_05820 [bacterium]
MNLLRTTLIGLTFLFLLIAYPASGQGKSARSQAKEQKKADKNNPWADREEDLYPVRRWEFGINLGAYFPDKYPANYYNGSPENINNLNYVLSNNFWYLEIKQLLGADSMFIVQGYPTNMHYKVSFTGGLFVRCNFNRKNGIFLQVNYTRLEAEDVITIEVDPPTYPTFPDIRLIPVVGKEERVMFDLGYQRSFPFKSRLYLFLQGGLTMSYTHVLKSVVVFADREYNLINTYGTQGYFPNSNSQEFNINQSAFGYGLYAGGGLGIPLTDMFGLEPGFFMQYYRVNLEGYPLFKPSFGAYLRILLSFASEEKE